jgi:ribosomal-protein-alanine N-acetyltransferase
VTPDALAALHAAAITTPRPWTATEFGALLASPGVFVSGDARAIAMGRVILDEAELLTIASHPNHRRKGLGRGALAAFESVARARGATIAHLEVAADNAAAIALYESAGYARTGLRRSYYRSAEGKAVDAVLMAKALRAA